MYYSDLRQLGKEVQRMQDSGVDYIHFTVVDGHFGSDLTFGAPVITSLRSSSGLPFSAHLMVTNPQRWISSFHKAGIGR